jgi:hypothetical protein
MVDVALVASSPQEIAEVDALVPGILLKLDRWCDNRPWYPGISRP